MNNPFQMHIIHTQITPCHALHIAIPSPFEENSVIEACVELHFNPDRHIYANMWGSLPVIPGIPEHRVKIATGYIPFPDTKPTTYGTFLDALSQTVVESKFFKDGTKLLLDLYQNAVKPPKNKYGD